MGNFVFVKCPPGNVAKPSQGNRAKTANRATGRKKSIRVGLGYTDRVTIRREVPPYETG